MRETEIRSALFAMKTEDRAKAITRAVDDGDDETLGAVLRGPVLLTGLGPAQREAIRHQWRVKRHPEEVARVARLRGALGDLDRAASLFTSFTLGLVDNEELKRAEQAEAAALAARVQVA